MTIKKMMTRAGKMSSRASRAPANPSLARASTEGNAGAAGAAGGRRPSVNGDKDKSTNGSGSTSKTEKEKPQQGMFVDAAAMKEKLRQNMAKPEYNVANFYKKDGMWQWLARNPCFDRTTLTVIGLNALYIWIDADYNDAPDLLQASWPFQFSENFFCVFFTLELFVRFMAFAKKRDCIKDNWFVFDTVMVVMMVMETWVMTMIIWLVGGGDNAFDPAVLKVLRLLRLTRLARMARLLRAMPELLILIKGMWAATRSVFFTLFLLLIIVYVFSIAFRQMTAETKIGDRYFHTVPAAAHTLLLRGTLMDDIGQMVSEIGQSTILLPIVFYVFCLISALTVMNMLIGVLCEVVSAVAATEKEESSVAYVKGKIQDIMCSNGIDKDGDGQVSKKEFVQILDNAQACRVLAEAGVDVFGLVDCADFIFQGNDDDSDEDGKTLDFTDFMEVVLQLRGSNIATVKDVMDLRKYVSVETKKSSEQLIRLTKLCHTTMALVKEIHSHAGQEAAFSGANPVSHGASPSCSKQQQPTIPLKVETLEEVLAAAHGEPAQANKFGSTGSPAAPGTALDAPRLDAVLDAGGLAPLGCATLHAEARCLASTGLREIYSELDDLRQHVDAELVLVMHAVRQHLSLEPFHSHSCRAGVACRNGPLDSISLPSKPSSGATTCRTTCDTSCVGTTTSATALVLRVEGDPLLKHVEVPTTQNVRDEIPSNGIHVSPPSASRMRPGSESVQYIASAEL